MLVLYKKRFTKQFKKLSPEVKVQFYGRLRLFADNMGL